MFTKYTVAISGAAVAALASMTLAFQEPGSGVERSPTDGNSITAAQEQGQTPTGTSKQQPTGSLASAMANFTVRTGLVVGPDDQGRLVVEHIRPESDAARLGIKAGDVLTSVNGAETNTMHALQNYLTANAGQTAFNIGVGRGNRNFTQPMGRQMTLMGMTVFPDSADRPVVNSVEPGSAAAKSGVKAGDVITSVGRQTTDTMSKFMNMSVPLVRALEPGEGVPFRLARNGKPIKVSIARPKDSDLQPLTPAEQHVLDRQRGALTPETQEVPQAKQNTQRERSRRRMANRGQQQNGQEQNGAALVGQDGLGLGMMNQNPNQQQQPQNGINGGFGLGLDGLGAGGLGVGGSTTGTTTNGGPSNGNINAVVAALFGTAQNQSTTQGTSATGQNGNTGGMRNNFTNAGTVGFVTIQSTVPLSQSANSPFGMNNTGTNGTGTTGAGINTTGTTPTAGTTTGTTNVSTTGVGNVGAGTTGIGNSGFGTGGGGVGASGFGAGNTGTTGIGANGAAVNGTNPVLGSQGGVNPVTGNTGTTPGVNPQTGNTGNGTTNNNNNNNGNNNGSTVSARITGLAQGQYSLVVTQYGSCGDAAAVATGPVAANLGTIQVSTNGQGVLTGVPVQFPPQAFVGRVVAVMPITAPGVGGAAIAPRSTSTSAASSNSTNVALACGVFRLANGRQPFTNGGAAAAKPDGTTNATGTTTGTGTGTGAAPVLNSPVPGGGPVENPLNGGGAGAAPGGAAPGGPAPGGAVGRP